MDIGIWSFNIQAHYGIGHSGPLAWCHTQGQAQGELREASAAWRGDGRAQEGVSLGQPLGCPQRQPSGIRGGERLYP